MTSPSAQPLSGRRIAVTRAREQASELVSKLAALGAEVIELPLIHVSKEISKHDLADVLLELGGFDWIVFTSVNGVRYFFEEFFRLFDDIRSLGLLRIAGVGEGTAKAIETLHLKVECQPKIATAEALADELIATGSLDHAKILVITGNLNRDTLIKKLGQAGAIVDGFQVYENIRTDLTGEPAAEEFRQRGADAVLFASSSAVQAFAAQAAALQPAGGGRRPLVGSIGPRTSEAIRKAGLRVDIEAKEPTQDALVAALVDKLGHAGDERQTASK
jgi:uroporphyrinogen-III synthase